MRRLVVELVVVPLIWLVACTAIGIGLAIMAGGHGSAGALGGAVFFGAIGAVGEVAYSIIAHAWKPPAGPRWFWIAAWALVASQTAFLVAETHFNPNVHVLIFNLSIVPAIVIAFVASWPFRRRGNDFVTDP